LPKNIKVTVKIEPEARVVADPDYLNRILHNLVNNSAQAMPTGGKLTVIALKDDNDIAIKVQDTGVGVPEELKDNCLPRCSRSKQKAKDSPYQ